MFGVVLLFAMGAEEGLSLLRSGDWGLEALLSVPAPALSETRRNGNAYLTVRYESIEHEFTNEAGLPQLPVFRRIIEVPAGA
ncbi:MAG: hypothetical protein ABIM59_01965, partial [candidate division WOR-3 bacterium]